MPHEPWPEQPLGQYANAGAASAAKRSARMAIVTCTTNVSKAERDRDARAGKESEHGSEAATRAGDATARAPAIARSISPRRGARGRESPAAPLWYRIWALIGGFVSLRNRTQARAQAIPIRSQAGPRWPEPVCANGARASDKRMIRGAVRDMPPLAATAQAPPTQTTIVKLLLIGDSGASRRPTSRSRTRARRGRVGARPRESRAIARERKDRRPAATSRRRSQIRRVVRPQPPAAIAPRVCRRPSSLRPPRI